MTLGDQCGWLLRPGRVTAPGCALALTLVTVAGCTGDAPATSAQNKHFATGPWFAERSADAGIDFRHVSGHSGRHLMPEIMGGGVALADLDGDNDLDLYFVQSGWATGTPADSAENQLYLNAGDGSFALAPDGHGASDTGYGMGVAAGDYDNDGDVDLYITNLGPNVLLRNRGDGRFEDVTRIAGVAEPGWGTAATFADLDADGDLDLFVTNYISWHAGAEIDCYTDHGKLTYCAPEHFDAPAADHLFRNNGDGSFTDVSARAGMNLRFGNGLGAVTADFNQDNRIDIFVANDMMSNQLWLNRGDLRFEERALETGVAVDANGSAKAGMGVATGDFDTDGDMDLVVVNLQSQSDTLFANEGNYFSDVTVSRGLSLVSRHYTRFGVVLADFDNDSVLDMYQANGSVTNYDASRTGGGEFAEPNLLLRGTPQGAFLAVEPMGGTPVSLVHTSRAVAVGDVDNDGGLDLIVVNRDAQPYLLRNEVPSRGNWAKFRVLTRSGRDAYGAVVTATIGSSTRHHMVQPGGSYLASSDPRVHFGLGDADGIRSVSVHWTDGEDESFGDFPARQILELRRGSGVRP
jgi:predicted nucleotidyltransferase